MKRNNLVVVYASCGQGHKKAAEAIKEYFSCPCLDILDYTHPLFKFLFSEGYRFISRQLRWLWTVIYMVSKVYLFRTFFSPFAYLIFSPFIRFMRIEKPMYIITTHFFLLDVAVYLKNSFETKIVTVVTDLGVHPLWVSPYVDKYLVAMEESKEELLRMGVSGKNIEVTGFPLRKGFRQKLDRDILKKKFFSDDKPTLLILSSSEGDIPYLDRMLKNLPEHFNLLVIYGSNNRRAGRLLSEFSSSSVRGFPYYEKIWELIEVADVVVTKPGGLTVFESLFKGKPLVFTHFIPGQEERNKELVVQKGWGWYVRSFEELLQVLERMANEGCGQDNPFYGKGEDVFLHIKGFIDEHEK